MCTRKATIEFGPKKKKKFSSRPTVLSHLNGVLQ